MANLVRKWDVDVPNYHGCSIGEQIDSLHRLLEIATFHHAEAEAFGDTTIRPLGHMWLVAKVSTKLARLPKSNERLQLTSTVYLGLASGVFWIVEGKDSAGNQIVEQGIWWTLADQTTLRPIRVADALRGTQADRSHLKALLTAWFDDVAMAEPTEQVASLTVQAADIDQNRHVHNTTYLKYLFDAIPILPQEYKIAYLSPLYLGDALTIRAVRQGNRINASGRVSSPTQSVNAFTAAMTVNS